VILFLFTTLLGVLSFTAALWCQEQAYRNERRTRAARRDR
jgi:hypothetical protein